MKRSSPAALIVRAALVVVASVVASMTLCGCRTGRPKIEHSVEFPSTLEVTAVTIDPFQFRWDEPAYRSMELTQRMIDAAVAHAGEKLFIFGTYEAIPPGQLLPRSIQSPVVQLLAPYGLSRDNLIVFRPWVETRVQSDTTTVRASDSGRGVGKARNERVTYIGHVEIVSGANQDPLGEVSGELEVDPLAARDDVPGDPAPELTRLMTALTESALDAFDKQVRLPASEARPSSAAFAFAPQKTWSYIEGSKPSFIDQLTKMDMLDGELQKQNRCAFENPGISDDLAAKLADSSGGLYVLKGDSDLGLLAGDFVTEIDGKPALPQLFARARLSPNPSPLAIKRGGEMTVIVLK